MSNVGITQPVEEGQTLVLNATEKSCPGVSASCEHTLHVQINAAGSIVFHNHEVQKLVGSDRSLVGSHLNEWLPERYHPQMNQIFPFVQLPKQRNCVLRILTSAGDTVRVNWLVEPVEFASLEQQLLLHGSVLPTVDAIREERALPHAAGFLPIADTQDLADRYPQFLTYLEALVAQHMTGSVWVRTHPEGKVHMTASAYHLLGIGEQLPDTVDVSIEEFIHPEDVLRVMNIANEPIAPGDIQDLHYRVITPAGDIRHIKQYTIATRDPELSKAVSFGLCIDETEAVIAERSQQALIHCLEAVVRATSEYELIARIAEILHTTGNYRYVVFYEAHTHDPSQITFTELVSQGDSRWLSTNIDPILQGIVEGKDTPYLPREVAQSGDPSCEFIPIYVKEQLALILAVWSDGPSAFTGTNPRLLPQVATQVQYALEKLATQRPIAVLTQKLGEELSSGERVGAEELRDGLRELLTAISDAGKSAYWKHYKDWTPHADWTTAPIADTTPT